MFFFCLFRYIALNSLGLFIIESLEHRVGASCRARIYECLAVIICSLDVSITLNDKCSTRLIHFLFLTPASLCWYEFHLQ